MRTYNTDSRLLIFFFFRLFLITPSIYAVLHSLLFFLVVFLPPPQWGAADAEINVPSGENTELKRSPFQAWSRSVYSHTCYAYCEGFFSLLISTLPVHLPAFFFSNLYHFVSPCVGCG